MAGSSKTGTAQSHRGTDRRGEAQSPWEHRRVKAPRNEELVAKNDSHKVPGNHEAFGNIFMYSFIYSYTYIPLHFLKRHPLQIPVSLE